MRYECEARPTCAACGAEWNDEMIALFELALGIGCACCNPFGAQPPDIVCHACQKVLFTAKQETAADVGTSGLDLTPDP